MKRTQFRIIVNKKNVSVTAERLTFYRQCKVLEATDKNANYYYLIFYKNHFINGAKRNQIRLHSHIHHVLTKGIQFKGTHPLTIKMVQSQTSFPIISFNQLYKNIQKSYSKFETAIILSYFDSFTKSGSIDKLFRHTFYEYRRNGQNLTAYQLLTIYHITGQSNQFVHDMLNDIQFQKYSSLDQNLDQIVEKHPIYAEAIAFDQFHSIKAQQILMQLYKQQHRPFDELAIRIALMEHDEANISEILSTMKDFSPKEQMEILEALKQIPIVQKQQMQLILTIENPNDMVHFLMTCDIKNIPERYIDQITESIERADPNVLSSFFRTSNSRLLELSNQNTSTLEKLVTPFIAAFLKIYSITDILNWLKLFRDTGCQLPIEQKLRKMAALQDDPDQQFALGELYIHFHQLEKSIDCFKWEMELHPHDPKPVTYLSKVYHDLGNHEEASAYKQLLIQMSK